MYIRPIDINEYYKSCKENEVKFNRPNFFKKDIDDVYDQFAIISEEELEHYIPLIIGTISLNTICDMKDNNSVSEETWNYFQQYVNLSCEMNNCSDYMKQNSIGKELFSVITELNKAGLPISEDTIRGEIKKRRNKEEDIKEMK